MKFNITKELKIQKISGLLLSSSYGDNKVFGQPLGVKTIGFIKIILSDGTIGFGETYSSIYTPNLVLTIAELFNQKLKGEICEDVLNQFQAKTFIPFVGSDGIIASVRSAVYLALLDAFSKSVCTPIYKLFNKELRPIPVYVSGGSISLSADDIQKDAEKLLGMGFNKYKLRCGLQGREIDHKRIHKALEIFDSPNSVAVDFIQGTLAYDYSVIHLKNLLDELKDIDLMWVEELTIPNNINKLKEIIRTTSIPIATGEAYSGKLPFFQLIEKNLCDIVQYDVTHTGSYIDCLEISEMAQRFNKIEALHVWGSSSALYSNAIYALINPNIQILEYPSVNFDLSRSIQNVAHTIEEGFMIFEHDFLGIGTRITKDIIDKYPYIKGSAYNLRK